MSLPKTMTAIAAERTPTGPRLYPKEILVPHAGPGQILIKVAAAGVNRADLLQVEGHHPRRPGRPKPRAWKRPVRSWPSIRRSRAFAKAMRSACCLPGGGYAEYAVASALCTLPVPKGVSLKDAGGLAEVYFTVWSNVFDTARLKARRGFPGAWRLQRHRHGGDPAHARARAPCVHDRGQPEKCAACVKLGATRAIDYKNEDFVTLVKAETNGAGVDVILDMVGGDYVMRNLNTLARGGRLVNIAYQKGAKVEVDFRLVQARLLTLAATGLRGRPDSEKALIRDHLAREVWPLFEAGRLKPVTDRVLPLAEAGAAHQLMRESRHIGKILLAP